MNADYSAASPKIKFHFMWHGCLYFSLSMAQPRYGVSQLLKKALYIKGEIFTNFVIRQIGQLRDFTAGELMD
jgi:hypothetical protein